MCFPKVHEIRPTQGWAVVVYMNRAKVIPIPAMVTQLPALEPAAPAVTTVPDAAAPDLVAVAVALVVVAAAVLLDLAVLLAAAALLVALVPAELDALAATPLEVAWALSPLRATSSARSAWAGMGGRKF